MKSDPIKLIKVSRARLLSLDFTSSETTPETTPTDEEREWFRIREAKNPEHAIERRKMSVCLDAEISILEDARVGFTYGRSEIIISAPVNAYNISRALEFSKHEAFAVLCEQGRVTVDGKTIKADKNTLGVDALSLCVRIADKFFFTSFL